MKGLVIRLVASAVAFAILVNVLPASMVQFKGGAVELALLAVIAGVINAFVKPIVKLLSFPISMLTLGLFGLVINAGMLLVIAYASEKLAKIAFTVGGFPTHGITADTIVGAVVASIALSIISTLVGLVIRD